MSKGVQRFSVVIPAYNEGDWLKKTVYGVLENTDYPDFEIIVVDDGSTDKSHDFLSKKPLPNVKSFRFEKSQGAIMARNKGARLATGEFLVFIDGHQKPVTTNWLKVLAKGLKKPQAGAVMVPIVSTKNKDQIGHVYGIKDLALEPTWHRISGTSDHLVPVIAGGCFALKKDLFDQLGGFNVHLKKWGREDLELSLRLWFLGYDLWTLPKAQVAHAFDHKRQFEISWDQVDHNTLLVADCYFDDRAKKAVYDFLYAERGAKVEKIQQNLASNKNYQAFKKALRSDFKRNFLDYNHLFSDFVPKNLL